MDREYNNIIISRTDNIGDVVLTLPMTGILKSFFPDSKIFFIGKKYTQPIINTCKHIDHFLDRDEIIESPEKLNKIKADVFIHVFPDKQLARLASAARIPVRIGTSHRFFHWLFCNKLVNFSRKNSAEHEGQLNLKLLKPLGIDKEFTVDELRDFFGMEDITELPYEFSNLLSKEKFNLIFHPKSKGSAREWPLDNYYALAKSLSKKYFNIYITGTLAEGERIKKERPELLSLENVIDLTGKLSLTNLISFIYGTDGLVACSTGPLHIGAALGKPVCGIYPPMRPIHPGRWAPVGTQAEVLSLKKNCNACKHNISCACINAIAPAQVKEKINFWYIHKK